MVIEINEPNEHDAYNELGNIEPDSSDWRLNSSLPQSTRKNKIEVRGLEVEELTDEMSHAEPIETAKKSYNLLKSEGIK